MNDTFATLVVDDIESFRIVLTESLTTPGHEVVTAPNIRVAMQHYSTRVFDLVVSDYSMPGGTGLDFLREVRQIDPAQPFILMSADLPRWVAREAQLNGARVLEKYDAMVQLPAAFMSTDVDPLHVLFRAPAVAHHAAAAALTQGVG